VMEVLHLCLHTSDECNKNSVKAQETTETMATTNKMDHNSTIHRWAE